MRERSFMKSLFFGVIDESLIFPWPQPSAQETDTLHALRVIMLPPVPDGNRMLKLGMPPVSALAFSTLPRWARQMYGRPSGPLSEA